MFGRNAVRPLICVAALLFVGQSSLGQASGSAGELFARPQSYKSGGANAASIAVADVNGDGKLDLLVANRCIDQENCQFGGIVGVLLGNGDGTFSEASIYSSGGYSASSIAVADVNEDGRPDLLVANDSNFGDALGGIGVLLGNGDGTFQAARSYKSGGYVAFSIAVGDVNGDGKPDLLVANCGAIGCAQNPATPDHGVVGVLLGNGNGTFQMAQTYNSGGWGAFSIAVGNANGDDTLDLLVANCGTINCASGGLVGVLLGNGNGTFQTVQTYSSGGWYPNSVAARDVNGDGSPDLLVANACARSQGCFDGSMTTLNVVGVLLGNGDGTFQNAQRYSPGGFQDGKLLAVGDVNGDGNPDLLAGTRSSQLPEMVGVLLGNGDGTFQKVQRYNSGGSSSSMTMGDVNSDGKPDLLVANACIYDVDCNRGGGVSVLLARHITTTDLHTNFNPSVYGEPVTLTATVNSDGPRMPSGTITFKSGTTFLGDVRLSSGVAKLTSNKLPAGTLSIVARYSGDSDYVKSTSAVVQVVNPASTTTTIKSSVSPSLYGQPVTFTANVTSPTARAKGTLTFTAGATTLGTVSQFWGGVARITTTALPKGRNTIKVTYSGTPNIIGSRAWLTQAVN